MRDVSGGDALIARISLVTGTQVRVGAIFQQLLGHRQVVKVAAAGNGMMKGGIPGARAVDIEVVVPLLQQFKALGEVGKHAERGEGVPPRTISERFRLDLRAFKWKSTSISLRERMA